MAEHFVLLCRMGVQNIQVRLRIEREVFRSMEAHKTLAGRYYRPELDVVRFLAFLFVFLHHTLPSGKDPRVAHLIGGLSSVLDSFSDACGYGLSLFFTLSAFLICELLLRERESAGTIAVKQFYIRRILRIWPLYYLALVLGAIVGLLINSPAQEFIRIGWFSIFMGSWYVVTQPFCVLPIINLWSISVEEQFYLFAPWLVRILSRKSLYAFCAALLILANGWLYFLGRESAVDRQIWFNSLVQFECFAGGILLCLALRGRLPSMTLWQRIVLLALSILCWFYTCFGLHTRFGTAGQHNPGSWHLICGYALATLASTAVIFAFLGVERKFLPDWTIYFGRVSYGLYVFHGFAIFFTDRFIIKLCCHAQNTNR